MWRERAAVRAWWALAESDLRMARLAAADEPPMYRQVCFHCQQAAEKGLKALLEALDVPIPRTHDLLILLDLVEPRLAQAATWAADAAVLTEFGVGPRYPGIAYEATAGQAQEALECAERLVAAIAVCLEQGPTG